MQRFSWTAITLLATAAHAGTCDFSAVAARTQQLMQAANLTDAGVAIGTSRGIVYKQYFGSSGNASAYGDSTIIPLASASKMLSGVRVMQLVDRGAINLDTPVAAYLPEFTDASKAPMTMREMFSHTAGYGNDENSLVLAAPTTLAQAVAYIACCVPQPYPPAGGYFAYGGISMQVGGEVAEVQGNEDWQAGWIHHVGTPLGITSVDWQGLGTTTNYRIAGGAQASLPDYSRVLAMLLGGGVGNGRRILSEAAVRTLNHNQTAGAAYGYAPPTANGSTAYGIGAWIEADVSASVDAPTISSIGAFGFTPWVDFDYGYFGVLMVEQQTTSIPSISERTHVALQDMSPLVRAALDASCPFVETYDEIFRDEVEGLL